MIRGGLPMLLGLMLAGVTAADDGAALNPERVRDVTAMLGAEPFGVGARIDDRAAWAAVAAHPAYADVVRRAEALLAVPLPEQSDDLYLEYSRNGNRTRWQSVAFERRGRVSTLALAECVEARGRFLPALEQVLRALCAERTWLYPAHDGNLANFNGTTQGIDLGAAHVAGNLGHVLWLLGDTLDPEVRRLVRENLDRRILVPIREVYEGRRKPLSWMTGTNNWNSVCLAGVTACALSVVDAPAERAVYIVGAEHYVRNFLRGFTPDGYCSEGVGYWNYGFGQFIILAEWVRQATGGRLDLLMDPAARAPAEYGSKITILGGVCPAFADCAVSAQPSGPFVWFVNRRLGLGLPGGEADGVDPGGNLYNGLVFGFPNGASQTPPAPASAAGPGPRTWFPDAGIYIGRPTDPAGRFAVALKGGHNAEHHNHNDVGSYVVVADNTPVLLDPGGETYTARTFSSRRYESRLLNSFGHPVPVIAGRLQRTGGQARGQLIRVDFTDAADTLEFDLSSCYEVPSLKRLRRTFVYSRAGGGSLTVTDSVEFAEPQSFGTAVLTAGDFLEQPDGLLFLAGDDAVRVTVTADGGTLETVAERIDEEAAVRPLRVGFNLREPVTRAAITVAVTPADLPAVAGTRPLNGGFELRSFGWTIPGDGLAAISDEQAAGGRYSLKITDARTDYGSNVTSTSFAIDPETRYALRGKVHHVGGSGIGMYIRFLDEDGVLLNQVDDRGNLPSLGVLEGAAGQWVEFALPFATPAGCVAAQIWIHSINASQVTGYLDDLEVRPAD